MKPFNKELLELFLAYGGDIYKEYKRYGTAILGKNLYEHIQNNRLALFKDTGEYLFEYNKDIEKYGKDYFINKYKSLLKDEADSPLHKAVIETQTAWSTACSDLNRMWSKTAKRSSENGFQTTFYHLEQFKLNRDDP